VLIEHGIFGLTPDKIVVGLLASLLAAEMTRFQGRPHYVMEFFSATRTLLLLTLPNSFLIFLVFCVVFVNPWQQLILPSLGAGAAVTALLALALPLANLALNFRRLRAGIRNHLI
jgi:uncharacterized membrane protein YhaH (DUF805 family)